jgi:hypothetical protein
VNRKEIQKWEIDLTIATERRGIITNPVGVCANREGNRIGVIIKIKREESGMKRSNRNGNPVVRIMNLAVSEEVQEKVGE